MTIRVIDVTLRDGGYVNNHSFSLQQAAGLVSGLSKAGLDFVEVGYYRPREERDFSGRPAGCCPMWYLDALAKADRRARLVAMAHVHQVTGDDYRRLADHGVAMVRLPTTPAKIETVLDHVGHIRAAGMTASVNLIRCSEHDAATAINFAERARDAGAEIFYIADSNGGLYPGDVETRIRALKRVDGIEIGFHAHDSLKLGFANALAALEAGATMIDGSLAGMGKGGGNCATEVLSVHLNRRFGRSFRHGDLARLIEAELLTWVDPRAFAQYESCLAAAFNLNIDDLRAMRDDAAREGVALLDLLDRRMQSARALAESVA